MARQTLRTAQTHNVNRRRRGEANAVAGFAFVTLNNALRKTIDALEGFLVFLTPEGSTTGLYVSDRSGHRFRTREIGNAHDSLASDYCIVANRYAESGSGSRACAARRYRRTTGNYSTATATTLLDGRLSEPSPSPPSKRSGGAYSTVRILYLNGAQLLHLVGTSVREERRSR